MKRDVQEQSSDTRKGSPSTTIRRASKSSEPQIVCNLTAGDMLFVLKDGGRFTLRPGAVTLDRDSYARLEANESFVRKREDGHIAVVNRPAKVPWERMAESVQRERDMEERRERDRHRMEERQAFFSERMEDAWKRLVPKDRRSDKDKSAVIREELREFEVSEYRRVTDPDL